MHLATIAFDSIFGATRLSARRPGRGFGNACAWQRSFTTWVIAALSCGGSADAEAGRARAALSVDDRSTAGHEYLTLKIILDSSLTPLLAGVPRSGDRAEHIAASSLPRFAAMMPSIRQECQLPPHPPADRLERARCGPDGLSAARLLLLGRLLRQL